MKAMGDVWKNGVLDKKNKLRILRQMGREGFTEEKHDSKSTIDDDDQYSYASRQNYNEKFRIQGSQAYHQNLDNDNGFIIQPSVIRGMSNVNNVMTSDVVKNNTKPQKPTKFVSKIADSPVDTKKRQEYMINRANYKEFDDFDFNVDEGQAESRYFSQMHDNQSQTGSMISYSHHQIETPNDVRTLASNIRDNNKNTENLILLSKYN